MTIYLGSMRKYTKPYPEQPLYPITSAPWIRGRVKSYIDAQGDCVWSIEVRNTTMGEWTQVINRDSPYPTFERAMSDCNRRVGALREAWQMGLSHKDTRKKKKW